MLGYYRSKSVRKSGDFEVRTGFGHDDRNFRKHASVARIASSFGQPSANRIPANEGENSRWPDRPGSDRSEIEAFPAVRMEKGKIRCVRSRRAFASADAGVRTPEASCECPVSARRAVCVAGAGHESSQGRAAGGSSRHASVRSASVNVSSRSRCRFRYVIYHMS